MSKIITFPNGLRLWVKPMKNTRSVSVGVFIGAGSMHENNDNSGVAHFIEHMVFKGTQKRTAFQIVDEMERFGIQINAFTSKNMTAYYTVSIDEHAEKCMDMLSDLYYNATFTEDNIQKEKGVVLEEISMSEDDSEDLCMELLCRAHFGNDQLAMPILGSADSVRNLSRPDIKEFMDKYYRSDNTLISIVGNISPEKAAELIKKYFEINGDYSLPAIITKGKARPQRRFLKKEKDIEQVNIGISFPSYSLLDKQSSTASLVTSMLGGGMSSRLFQKLREELGLVYNIYANDYQYVTDGFINIFFATNPSTAKQALLAVRETILRVIEDGFTADELEKSKAQFKAGVILAAESSAYIMRAGGRYAILTSKEFNLDKKLKDIEKVTPDDIAKALRYIFNLKAASVSYVGKKSGDNLLQLFVKGEKDEAAATV